MKFNIAIVGCGRISGHHIKAISNNNHFKLISVCDLNINRAKEYADNIDFYTNYRKMFEKHPEIQIVVVATPSGMHLEHSEEFISKYKKHVIVEKPTFMSPSQGNKIYKIASQNGVKIFPIFQNRYNKAVQRVKSAILSRELGEIRLTSVRVRWCRPQRYYDLSEWRGTYSHDGGALSNQGIHHIDLLRYLGGEISEVNCSMATLGSKIEAEDTAVATFKYKTGALGSLEITTAARPDDFEASISIIGSKGMAQIGGIAVNLLNIFTPNPLDCKKYSDDFSDLNDRGRVYGRGHSEIYRSISKDLNQLEKYSPAKDDIIKTLSLQHAFYASHESNKSVKISEKLESSKLGGVNEKISNLYRI